MIQRCFDDNKGDDKKLKGQSKNEFKMFKIESRKNEFKMFKIESRTLQDSRIKHPRIKIKIQESREDLIKIQESREELIKISMKRFFQKLSSTWIFLKTCLPNSFYSLVIDYQIIVIDYQ